MSERIARKTRKVLREEIEERLKLLRPKPKYIPAFIWRMIYRLVFKTGRK